MKALWLCLCAALCLACTSPEPGGDRGGYKDGARGAGGVTDGGVQRLKTCGDVVCDPNATCSGVGDDAKCACVAGYEGDGTRCTDVDECAAANDCNVNADCLNRPGRYLCQCKDGFVGDGKTCDGVNECQAGANPCDPNALCEDAAGGFACTCRAGYRKTGDACADVDECQDAASFSCATNAHCTNTFGGYGCECDAGFTGDGNVSCRSLCDAARLDRAVCAAQGLCRVDGDGALCDACRPGFTGDGKSCRPVTCEAACDGLGTDDDSHAVCGSDGKCSCAPGFQGSVGSCADVDECAAGGGGCGANAQCRNVDGGHVCSCKAGFAREGAGQCADVDECKATPGPCHPDATCTNTVPGASGAGYECRCKAGFSGDGSVCEDVDECKTDSGGCGANAACVNRRGSSSCECRAPLVGDPSSCHCDLEGVWAMRQDLDTCWKGRPILEGTDQDVVSSGEMEATVWELVEIHYDGSEVLLRRKGCGSDNTPDLISPLFRETYSAYIPYAAFDRGALQDADRFVQPGIVPDSPFVTPSIAAVVGLDLGSDPMNAPWPASFRDIPANMKVDPDGDEEPGLTFWPRPPSEPTDTGAAHYKYLPVRPAVIGTKLYIDERAGCVSAAARVLTHLEGLVESCTRITGEIINGKTEGRALACMIVDKKPPCNASNPNDCPGWTEDVGCTADDWKTGTRCLDEDVERLDDDQNQIQDSRATFEIVRMGNIGETLNCPDVRRVLPPIVRPVPTISCTTPP